MIFMVTERFRLASREGKTTAAVASNMIKEFRNQHGYLIFLPVVINKQVPKYEFFTFKLSIICSFTSPILLAIFGLLFKFKLTD